MRGVSVSIADQRERGCEAPGRVPRVGRWRERPAREVMMQIGGWSSEEAMADTAGRGRNVAKVMVVDCKSISPESPRLHPNSLRLENTRHPSGSGRSPP